MSNTKFVAVIFYGSCIGLSIASLFGMAVYACCFMTQDQNKYDSLYPGRRGHMGLIVIGLCILPLIAIVLLFIAFIFSSCSCCKCLSILFAILGSVCLVGTMAVEAVCIIWGGKYGAVRKNYDLYYDDKKFQEYADSYKTSYWKPEDSAYFEDKVGTLPGSFNYYYRPLNNTYIPATVPVCYYENKKDADNLENGVCMGGWSSKLLIDFYEEAIKRKQGNTEEKDFWEAAQNEFEYQRSLVLYNKYSYLTLYPTGNIDIYASLYLMCSYMISFQCLAVFCFVFYSFMYCFSRSANGYDDL